jgi:hypothetical protein
VNKFAARVYGGRIKGLQTYLATLPGIDQTISIVDVCELLDRAIQNNQPGKGTGVIEEEKRPEASR